MDENNKTKKVTVMFVGLRREIAEKERQEDLVLLQYAMNKEKAVEQEEEEKRNKEKAETRRYQEYLRELMIHEAEDTRYVDEVRIREENKVLD